jgi:hypothetical protein
MVWINEIDSEPAPERLLVPAASNGEHGARQHASHQARWSVTGVKAQLDLRPAEDILKTIYAEKFVAHTRSMGYKWKFFKRPET